MAHESLLEKPVCVGHCRIANADDTLALATLCREAIDELVGERGGVLLVGQPEDGSCLGLDGELTALARTGPTDGATSTEFQWFVAMMHDIPVGTAFVQVSDQRGTMIGVVKVLYVEQQARHHGLGSALIDAALTWAIARGCIGLDVAALPGQRATKSFLESNGFKARMLIMHRPASDES